MWNTPFGQNIQGRTDGEAKCTVAVVWRILYISPYYILALLSVPDVALTWNKMLKTVSDNVAVSVRLIVYLLKEKWWDLLAYHTSTLARKRGRVILSTTSKSIKEKHLPAHSLSIRIYSGIMWFPCDCTTFLAEGLWDGRYQSV